MKSKKILLGVLCLASISLANNIDRIIIGGGSPNDLDQFGTFGYEMPKQENPTIIVFSEEDRQKELASMEYGEETNVVLFRSYSELSDDEKLVFDQYSDVYSPKFK